MRFRHFVQGVSLKVIGLMLLIVLPFDFLALYVARTATAAMISQAKISVQSVMQNYVTELGKNMETAQYMLWNIRFHNSYGIYLAKQEEGNRYNAARIYLFYEIKNYKDLADGADGYYYYMEKLDDLLVWQDSTGRNEIQKEEIHSQLKENPEQGWSLGTLDGRQILCSYTALNDVAYGCWFYLDTWLDNLQSDIQYEKIELSFSDVPAEEGEMSVVVQGKKKKFYLNAAMDKEDILSNLSGAYYVIRWGSFLMFFLVPILYLTIQRLLLFPLWTVNEAERKLKEGDLDYRITAKANSIEYAHSFASFNEMAQRIKELKIDNYEKELKQKEMELKNLQLQIRPHFLLNTFNLIYTLTQRHEEKAVQQIILYLSDYFRYLFRSGHNLELFEKEQALIEAYLKMCEVRYPGNIEAEFSYDPEISFVRVPPLLIHNFLENIVKYAIIPGKVCHISIVGQYADRKVTFMIMDDGAGISPEQLKSIYEAMHSEETVSKHIGYANSYKRLKYFYGEEADISITSDKEEGTCVILTFPYDLEVQE